MKKFLVGLLALSLLLVASMTNIYADVQKNGKETVYTVPKEDSFEAANAEVMEVVEAQLKNYLKLDKRSEISFSKKCYEFDQLTKFKNSSNFIVYIDSKDINIVKNGITAKGGGAPTTTETRVIYHNSKAVLKNKGWKYATGLAGGYKGATHLCYTPTGGGKYTFSVSAAVGYGPVSISATVGKQAATGLSMSIPTTSKKHYNRVQAKKDYKVTPYTVQIRKSKKDPWKTYSKGNIASYYRVSAKCVKVK